MGAYFEVLRPAGKNELDGADPDVAAVLKALPPSGYVSADELEGRYGSDCARRALEWACGRGVMYKAVRDSDVMGLESVRFWLGQLNPPQMKRFGQATGTKRTYVHALEAFSRWLPGRRFPAARKAGSGTEAAAGVEFSNVEELLRFCGDPEQGTPMARRVTRQYLTDLAASKNSLSTALCAARR